MLQMIVLAGVALNHAKARYASAWVVQVPGPVSTSDTFTARAGDGLVKLGLIELHPDPAQQEVRSPTNALIGHRYVPTAAGITAAERRLQRKPKGQGY